MNKSGPIVVIEDDLDDQQFLIEIFEKLNYKNEIIYFTDGHQALEYLTNNMDLPFIIISDINMPKLNGLELRNMIHNNEALRLKCIPYLFLTTASSQQYVIDAYSKSVQGFFVKKNNIEELELMIKKIVEYWQECEAPNPAA